MNDPNDLAEQLDNLRLPPALAPWVLAPNRTDWGHSRSNEQPRVLHYLLLLGSSTRLSPDQLAHMRVTVEDSSACRSIIHDVPATLYDPGCAAFSVTGRLPAYVVPPYSYIYLTIKSDHPADVVPVFLCTTPRSSTPQRSGPLYDALYGQSDLPPRVDDVVTALGLEDPDLRAVVANAITAAGILHGAGTPEERAAFYNVRDATLAEQARRRATR